MHTAEYDIVELEDTKGSLSLLLQSIFCMVPLQIIRQTNVVTVIEIGNEFKKE